MAESAQLTSYPEHPLGTFDAKVDDKGRLRLPNVFSEYLDRIGERRVFITTFDLTIARIYPLSVWKETEKSLTQEFDSEEDAEAADHIMVIINHYGQAMDVNEKGLVLLPTTLRRDLALENAEVWVQWVKGRFDVQTDQQYRARLENAKKNLQAKIGRFGSKYR